MSSIQKAKDAVSKKAKRLSNRITSHYTPPPSNADIVGSLPSTADDGTDLSVPEALQKGMEMLKISTKGQKRVVFRLDPDAGHISYESHKRGIVPIEAIKEIRTGENTKYDCIRFEKPEEWRTRWLTIIYIVDGSYKTLHIVADNPDVIKLWQASLAKVHAIRQGLMFGLGNVDLRQTIWERRYWKSADKEGDQRLSFGEVTALCKRLNVNVAGTELEKLFREADAEKQGYIDFSGFQCFVKSLKYRPELTQVYGEISAKYGKFDYGAFRNFMIDTQKTSVPDADLKSMFAKYTDVTNLTNDHTMTLEQFSSFLLSPDNDVFSEGRRGVWQDMTFPLPDYYLSSSHNTYLIGHQLVGVSTIEGYIRALLHSCRSVELDIYDGDDEPMVYHGKTFTSKVSLRDVCKAIAKYAFVTSPYPLMISAEVHCGISQQEKMVDIMIEVFGNKLVQAPVENRLQLEKLPSPEELKYKILLKAKDHYVVAQLAELKVRRELQRMQQEQSQHGSRVSTPGFTSSSESSSNSSKEDNGGLRQRIKSKWRKLGGKESPPSISPPSASADATSTTNPGLNITKITIGNSSTGISSLVDGETKPKMSLRLVSLLVYTVGVKCHGIGRHAAVTYKPEHIFSLSESSVNRLMKASGVLRELIEHTQTNLVRIYPKGLRVNSTNYEPHRYWAAGAQVVAINWQTFDLGYTINQAMFHRNGRSGFVLKPFALRLQGRELLSQRSRHFFDITIISAQQLPRLRDDSGQEIIDGGVVDPFVEVTLHIPGWTTSPFLPSTQPYKYHPAVDPPPSYASGVHPTSLQVTSTARRVSMRTGVVKNNGFNPVWQSKLSIPFDCVGGPDGEMQNLIFVEVAVRQDGAGDDKHPIAIFCAPLGTVEPGYRHLPLYDMQYTQHMFSTLFVKSSIKTID